MTASEQRVFLRFMKKHKAWNKFKKQVKKEFPELPLSEYFSNLTLNNVLPCGFQYDKSPQGAAYWYDLEAKLQKVAKNG